MVNNTQIKRLLIPNFLDLGLIGVLKMSCRCLFEEETEEIYSQRLEPKSCRQFVNAIVMEIFHN